MSIGVVIPCYKHHIPKLIRLLDSIENQTRKPDIVMVSCSSTKDEEFPKLKSYSFPVKIHLHAERKNAAENRNFGASLIETDYISFFDADDIMHPQRLEAIEYVIKQTDADIVLHSYLDNSESKTKFVNYSSFFFIENELKPAPSKCVHIEFDYKMRIHHSQVTIRREIFEKVCYNETKEYERREDCIFCYDVLCLSNIKNAYIYNPLSQYDYEGVWYS